MQIRRFYRRIKRLYHPPGLVLMYHRIADQAVDPWQLAVSPEHFEEQLQVLHSTRQVLPLQQLVGNKRPFSKRNIAITFDDGYLDNYLVAKPLLEKYKLPATFFISSCNLDADNEFWWDELEKIILEAPELPQQLKIEIHGAPFFFDLGEEQKMTAELREKHKGYIAFEPPTRRAQLYLRLWEQLSPLTAIAQQKAMEHVRKWAGCTAEARQDYRCMSLAQLRTLASNKLFSLGGHTASHPALAYHSKELQREEIRSNKVFLENVTGKKADLFAYPSGNYNHTTVEVLKEEGFAAAFTTKHGRISRQDDPYLLNRLQVNNWDGKAFRWVIEKCLER